ncbi:MAG: biotin--[acetyl-CoA-carboxylase] ligase [Proteobacteria bacterium]|nr:biotin--[acetyl-CoA-carboxylase] ligase [Pseudomonadota bacterium]
MFNEHDIADRLSGRLIGNRVHFLREVDSTNIYASRLAMEGAPDGTVVIADCQTKGKGRMGRVWQSPPERNIYTSIILRPAIEPAVAPQITLVTGVAVAELFSEYCPKDVTLKWPNDVQIKGKKVCGILTEMRTSGEKIDFVIVGIGINIGMKKEEFHEEFRDSSTSLSEEVGTDISRLDFAVKLYASFERWYERFLSEGFIPVKDAWMKYSGIIGKDIKITLRDDIQAGKAVGIDEYGALLILNGKNRTRRIMAGDVSLTGD